MPQKDFCCVPLCSVSRSKAIEANDGVVLFHTFPKQEELRQLWVLAIRRDVKEGEFSIKRDTCVCSHHFVEDDYVGGKKVKGARRKADAVPSIFSWTPKTPKRRVLERSAEVAVVHTCQTREEWLEEELEASRKDIADLQESLADAHSKYFSLTITYERVKDTPAKLSYYTGIPNGYTFEALWSFLSVTEDGINGDYAKSGESRKRTRGGGRKPTLPLKEQLFFTLVRLRRGLDEDLLADLAGMSQATMSRMITKWVNFLYLTLGSLPLWPSPEQVAANLPACFREQYDKTFAIIDCTEIRCEVPSSLPDQSQFFSAYKAHTTLKCLLGISPSGAVIFVSELFTGCISDREITQRSGFLDLVKTLPRGLHIMADKGFDIEDLLVPFGIRLNVPPKKRGDQLPDEDVLRTQHIARVRIHVERAICRVKNFAIFSKVIPLSLVSSVNQMWTVCCILTNFNGPLIDES